MKLAQLQLSSGEHAFIHVFIHFANCETLLALSLTGLSGFKVSHFFYLASFKVTSGFYSLCFSFPLLPCVFRVCKVLFEVVLLMLAS